jgi:hypothetical protein
MVRRESDKAPEKAMDGLLRHTLRHAVPTTEACPDPEILAAYFERSLDTRETAEYELHLSNCARCREQQAAMVRAYAPGERADEEKPRWAWLLDWRWLAPATAVLAFVAFWYARRPEMTAEQPYLAMSRSAKSTAPAPPENAPKGASTPAPVPDSSADDYLKKAERQESDRSATGNAGSESEARELAARKAANELDSNLANDSAQKDKDALRRDSGGIATTGASAADLPAAPSAPTMSSAPQAQAAVSSATNESPAATVKSKQLATPALSNRTAGLLVEQRSAETLIRTPNPQILWRIGVAGVVERSIDGGATWMGQLPGNGAQLTAGAAPADQICWVVGRDGSVLLTTNAIDWKTLTPPAKTDFVGVAAKDGMEATVTAADGRRFATKDGGATWTRVP